MTIFICVPGDDSEVYVNISAECAIHCIIPNGEGCVLEYGDGCSTHVDGITAEVIANRIEQLLETKHGTSRTLPPTPGAVRIPRGVRSGRSIAIPPDGPARGVEHPTDAAGPDVV